MVSDGHRDIVCGKPKRISRDIEEYGFSDLQGGGRGFESLSAHHCDVARHRRLMSRVIVDVGQFWGW